MNASLQELLKQTSRSFYLPPPFTGGVLAVKQKVFLPGGSGCFLPVHFYCANAR